VQGPSVKGDYCTSHQIFPLFMKLKGSLQCSQGPTTGLYSKPV